MLSLSGGSIAASLGSRIADTACYFVIGTVCEYARHVKSAIGRLSYCDKLKGFDTRRGRLSARHRRDAFDLDQHPRIGQLRNDAGGARRIRRRAEGVGIKRVHRRDVGRARQQHVDFDEMRNVGAGVFQDALDGGGDETELRGEIVGQLAGVVEAGNAGDEQKIADARGVGERRGFDVRGRRDVGEGQGGPVSGGMEGGLSEASPP